MNRVWTRIGATIVTVVVGVIPAAAAPPVSEIIQKTKAAYEPARPSLRTLAITVSNMGDNQKFIARQARKQLADSKRMVTVMMSPNDIRGMAFMVSEPNDPAKPTVMWTYVPYIQRVRKIVGLDGFQHFLGTDFTYADLGFTRVHKQYQLLGMDVVGTPAYKVDEKLPPGQLYYSHIVAWIAESTLLPLRRDYYDPEGTTVWKREVFDSVSTIDGVPTVMHVKMTDLIENTSTDLNVTQIKYDTDVPDSIFAPESLPKLADDPLWGGAPQ